MATRLLAGGSRAVTHQIRRRHGSMRVAVCFSCENLYSLAAEVRMARLASRMSKM